MWAVIGSVAVAITWIMGHLLATTPVRSGDVGPFMLCLFMIALSMIAVVPAVNSYRGARTAQLDALKSLNTQIMSLGPVPEDSPYAGKEWVRRVALKTIEDAASVVATRIHPWTKNL